MPDDVRYRWIDGPTATDEEWSKIDEILATKGWASLNRNTSRILVAEVGDRIAFHAFQLVPYCGPLFVPPSLRGTGLAEELSDKMLDFLNRNDARGWLVTAESPFAAQLCEARGMQKINMPVYVAVPFGGVEV